MRKILFGALLGAALMYFLDPVGGAERRRKLSGQWGEQKDTVLEAVRSTASTATSVSQGVGDIVGGKVAELKSDGESTNGNVLAGTGPETSGHN